MATVSSHTLNGVDGTHADGIVVQLHNLRTGRVLFAERTANGGRLSVTVDIAGDEDTDTYELVFETGDYWSTHVARRQQPQIMKQVVLRFGMPDADARYHMPVIINPNAYSCWWSEPE